MNHRRFVFWKSDERYALSPDLSVRMEGERLELPAVHREWLCGDVEESSSTEQSVLLTRGYLEEIWKEREQQE